MMDSDHYNRQDKRRAERKAEQLDILTGVLAALAFIFCGVTLWFEIIGIPALTMALTVLVFVVAWFFAWTWRVRAYRQVMRMRQREGDGR